MLWLLPLGALALGLILAGPTFLRVRAQRLSGLSFFADAYVWLQDGSSDGRVQRISPGDGIYYQPCIRPDGRRAVFSGAAEGPPRIWVADLETFELRALTDGDSAAVHPVYSWDGERIAFCSDRDAVDSGMDVKHMLSGGQPSSFRDFEAYVMDADGSNVVRVTDSELAAWRPTFRPDGEALVLSLTRPGYQALFEVPVPGPDGVLGEPRQIEGTEATHRPWFTADGRRIFFHNTGASQHRIHSVPIEGGARLRLDTADFERAHGSFVDPHTGSLLVHAIGSDGVFGLWELPLGPDGTGAGPARKLEPPGFERAYHGTRGANGNLVFDLPRDAAVRLETWHRLMHPPERGS